MGGWRRSDPRAYPSFRVLSLPSHLPATRQLAALELAPLSNARGLFTAAAPPLVAGC